MKVMLIFPPLLLEHRYSHDVGDAGGNLPPLGLLYIAAVLEKTSEWSAWYSSEARKDPVPHPRK